MLLDDFKAWSAVVSKEISKRSGVNKIEEEGLKIIKF